MSSPDPSAGYYTVQLPAPAAPSGATATATVTVNSKGKVTGVSVSSGGNGYVTPPRVVIAGGTGKGAAATAILSAGSVNGFTIAAAGSGYSASSATATIDPPGRSAGTGWAAMTVSESGAVHLAGKLGDGTGFSAGATISAAGGVDRFALYLPLYPATSKSAAPGAINGVMTFEPETGTDCDGTLSWLKPAQTTGALYQAGFFTSVAFAGARYAAPSSGLPLQFTSAAAAKGSVAFSGGNLTGSPTDTIAVSTKGVVTETGSTTDKLRLTLNAKTGLLRGSFLPQTPKPPTASLSGILFQKTNVGVGQFLGSSQAGSVTITPQ